MAKVPPNFIEFYDTKHKFKRWVQRFESALTIYAITVEGDKNSYLLHYIGADLYETLCDLVSPAEPSSNSYSQNVEILTKHLDPDPLEIAEYFKYHHRHQKEGESIKEYLASLRKMASTCNFGTFLDTALRNQFVCGVRSQKIRDRLLESSKLTLEQAVKIATGIESAQSEGTQTIEREVQAVYINKKKPSFAPSPQTKPGTNYNTGSLDKSGPATSSNIVCFRCGGNHYASKCTMMNIKCNFCQKTGHLRKMCLRLKRVNAVDVTGQVEDNTEEVVFVNNCNINANTNKFWINVKINGSKVSMEFDSGSAVSIMNLEDYREFCDEELVSTKTKLCTYSNQFLNVLGVANVTAAIGKESRSVKLYIISGNQHPLLGREWINSFNAFCGFRECIAQVNQVSPGIVSHAHSLQKLFKKYCTLFDDKSVGKIKGDPVALHLKENAKPIFYRARPVPFALKERVEMEIDNLVREGVLIKVDYSEYATPVVPVVKANGKIRLCGDYKITLNKNLLVDEHPLPTSEELFNGLAGGDKFSKIDLRNAYLNWEVREEDQHLLTLNTHKGLYKCTRLMFGLNCAPAKWQRKIENILKGIPGVHCFIDDIRISAPNDEEHLDRLEQVFARLSEFGLKVNLEKSEFMKDMIEYCGYKISRHGIHKSDSKIRAVVGALQPKNISELQALLGLVNYYGRFLPNLSNTLEPLHELLRKETNWVWSADCEKALSLIKKQMLSDTVLAHYTPSLPLILATDASSTGVGAVLSHIMPDGTERPIQYASQTLNVTQRKWAQIDKEAYAIVFGVKRFFQYLYGRKFILYTDHKPLVQIFSPSKALPHFSATRMQHYAIFLQGFQYDIKYKNTKSNANADVFSRLPMAEEVPSTTLEEADVFQVSMITVLPVTVTDIAAATLHDISLKPLLGALRTGKMVPPNDRFGIEQIEFSLQNDCLMRGSRVVVPICLRSKILKDLHSCHFGATRMLALARSYCWWPGMDKDIRELVKNCTECSLHLNSPPSVAPKHTWEYPSKPFERVHIDFAGKFHNVYFLLLIDAFSKWPEIHILNRIDTDSTIEVLDKIFTTFGYPDILTSDNGTQFVNPKFNEFLKMRGITHRRSAPYNPATNGQVERYVQTFKNKLRCLSTSRESLEAKLNQILFQYRITPHPATGRSPSDLVLSYQPNSRFSLICPDKRTMLPRMDPVCPSNSTEPFERKVTVERVRTLVPGDRVVARNYTNEGHWKLGVINKVFGKLHYSVKLDNGMLWRRHIDQIRKVGGNIPILEESTDAPVSEERGNNERPISSLTPACHSKLDSSQTEQCLDSSTVAQPDSNPNIVANSEAEANTASGTSCPEQGLRRSQRVRKPVVRLDL